MNLKFLACVLLSITLFHENSFAQQDGRNRAEQIVRSILSNNDKDGDGIVSRNEAGGRLKQNFDRVDTNSDGELNEDELTRLAERLSQANRGQRQNTALDNVELQTDVAYRPGNEKWKLDLMLPKETSQEPRPAIVFVHGGGWRSGDKGGGQWRAYPLQYASRGYVCVSVNYRLTNEGTVLDCIADCKCAVRWLRSNATKYNVDPDRIGAYGNSAGAHLVSMLGLSADNKELEGDGPHKEFSSAVQAVCCSAPPTNFVDWGKKSRSAGGGSSPLFGDSDVDRVKKLASPVSYVSEDSPPFLIVHGTADSTVPVKQGDDLNAQLREAGCQDVTYLRIDGAGHGVFGQHAKRTGPAMQEFFDRTLKKIESSPAIKRTLAIQPPTP